jgi:hypothetical protein
VKHPTILTAASIAVVVTLLPVAPAVAQGRAIQRGAPPATRAAVAVPRPAGQYYRPTTYYRPYGYYPPYGYYRPYGYYYPYPYYYGFGIGFGFGYGGYYPYYPPYYSYPGPYYGYGYAGSSLHVMVTPREAEVFVDGYYAGKVDDFDGTFQRLRLDPGEHSVQLYLAGHRSVQQELYLQPGNTFNIRTTLQPLGAGEPEPVRPVAPANPPNTRSGEAGAPTSSVAPRPLPRTATPADFGTLAIRVRPGDARVTIDGEQWESSPDADRLTVTLAPGVHRLEISRDGYRPYSADVSVKPGQAETVNVALAR